MATYRMTEAEEKKAFEFLMKHFDQCTGYKISSFDKDDIWHNCGENQNIEKTSYLHIRSINKGFSCPVTFQSHSFFQTTKIKCNICGEEEDITDYDMV